MAENRTQAGKGKTVDYAKLYTEERISQAIAGKISFAELNGMSEKQLRGLAGVAFNYMTQGKLAEAKTIFAGLTALNGKIGPFHTGLGEVLLKEGALEDALAQFNAALTINPDDPVALVDRGEVYLKQGKINEAAVDLKRVIQLDPKLSGNPAKLAFRLAAAALRELDKRGIATNTLEKIGQQLAEKAAKIKTQKAAVAKPAVKVPAGKPAAKPPAKPAPKPAGKSAKR